MTSFWSDPLWQNPLRPSLPHVDNWSVAGDLLRVATTVNPAADSDGHIQ
jgi:hypothetical protein